MLIPIPQPDELIFGFVGRIRMLNGLLDHSDTVHAMMRCFAPPDVRPFTPYLAPLAPILALTKEALAAQHTMAPLFNTIVRIDAHRPQWDPIDTELRNFGSLKGAAAIMRPHYCPSCSAEDVKSLGFSYWRRIHHLPGISFCIRHAAPLRSAHSVTAFQYCPEKSLEDASDRLTSAPIHRITSRYTVILEYFLAQPRTLKLRDARVGVLEHQVLNSGYRDQGRPLAAMPVLTTPWDFIRLGDIQAHDAITLDQSTLTIFKKASAFNATAYAMALAIIFPTAKAAIAFHAANSPPPARRHYEGRIDQAFWSVFDKSAGNSGLTLLERYVSTMNAGQNNVADERASEVATSHAVRADDHLVSSWQ